MLEDSVSDNSEYELVLFLSCKIRKTPFALWETGYQCGMSISKKSNPQDFIFAKMISGPTFLRESGNSVRLAFCGTVRRNVGCSIFTLQNLENPFCQCVMSISKKSNSQDFIFDEVWFTNLENKPAMIWPNR